MKNKFLENLVHRLDYVKRFTEAARLIAKGQWDIDIPTGAPGKLGIFADAFLKMKDSIFAVQTNMEKRLEEVEFNLAHRTRQLQIASEFAKDATATHDIKVLMDRTVNSLVERFGYSYAGIFLVDNHHEYALLQAASGENGRIMLEQGCQLPLDIFNTVGYVAIMGEPKIALDSGIDAIQFQYPLIPNIHSELALPLEINHAVIGVLDILSQETIGFGQQDVDGFQILADQLAIASDSVHLFHQHKETLHQLDILQNRVSNKIRIDHSQSAVINGYQLDAAGLRSINVQDTKSDDLTPHTLPISERGKIVALLKVWPTDAKLAPGELKLLDLLGDRINQAVESAHIFEETHRRVNQMLILQEIVSSTLFQTKLVELLFSLAKKLLEKFNLSCCDVLWFEPNGDSAKFITSALAYDTGEDVEIEKIQIIVEKDPLLQKLVATRRSFSLNDIVHNPLALNFHKMALQRKLINMLMVPLLLQGEVKGALLLSVQEPTHRFDEDDFTLLDEVSLQISPALEAVCSYEQATQQAERNRILARVSSPVLASRNVDNILQTAIQQLAEGLGVPKGSILLRHAEEYPIEQEGKE